MRYVVCVHVRTADSNSSVKWNEEIRLSKAFLNCQSISGEMDVASLNKSEPEELYHEVPGIYEFSSSSSNTACEKLAFTLSLLPADFVPINPKSKSKKYKYPAFYDPYGPKPLPSDKIIQLAEPIATLPPEKRKLIGPALRERLRPCFD
ncbi:hypothetical protein Syun_000661 [Stephania yunnanensis]|uniref:Uncharacterized protein n=1 Tax=Stephania yunnanensis TaxID=152371 RepID=A0AAP0QA45_9MAGN